MFWQSQAPSNIALIKYMGKSDSALNVPDNPSLSYTLEHLTCSVELRISTGKQDTWEPMDQQNPLTLDTSQQQRFISHLQHIKAHYDYDGHFIIRSHNNFPTAVGLASSAASFAALTLCANRALGELTQRTLPSIEQLAHMSRLGSGSSCRSFIGPWCLWDETGIRAPSLPIAQLTHMAIILEKTPKKISSSDAHQRVKTSPLYPNRHERAQTRLQQLLQALNTQAWRQSYEIVKAEFLDMHQLFTTSQEPFEYITTESSRIIEDIEQHWQQHQDGPLITMDAGPNIHLLFRTDQTTSYQHIRQTMITRGLNVI